MTQTQPAITLAGVRNLAIDDAQLRKHVLAPQHLAGVSSSRGLEEGTPAVPHTFGADTAYHFDVDGFGKALHAALKDSVNGYVMRLRHDGNTIYTLQWNWARRPGDGSEGWTPGVRMHVASVSKLITGIAMTRLLLKKGVPYDTPIVNYLPKYWAKGPNVSKITFRHLMTHTSGLNFKVKSSASDFAFMKSKIAAGTTHLGEYSYQNMNFGLCRILIATLNGNVSPGASWSLPFINNSNDVVWDYVTIEAYAKYVRDNVFAPAGVVGPTLWHGFTDALAYGFPPITNGWNSGDLKTMSGGAAWHMSVDELLSVMNHLRRKGTIMSAAHAQQLLDNRFGIDVKQDTPLGKLYNKNGRWTSNGRDEQALAYFLPQGMELVVLTNSPVGAPAQSFRDTVTKLYLANVKAS
jgi:CubicO group peptidase (beta-lactamase class C family)